MKRFLPLLAFALLITAHAQETAPADHLAAPLKDYDGYFPFTAPATREAWERRAADLRKRILVSQGLFPLPAKTPLNAVIHGAIAQDDYTVEKVFFESMPGFFVTGNLYRPRGKSGPFPVVLVPHGHWPGGRFQMRDDAEMKSELASGGEHFAESGRSVFQSLCMQLARMGCVAFHYDMLGYADSQQISMEVAHQFAVQRPEASGREDWGLFSAQAELHLQSVMGLQTWNSLRALDFVCTLPDVDPKRIGMTGGSGGGTQTFIAGAIDPRITVAFPAVMVSTAMQGGCTCENASLLRIGTGNVEIAALFAPKPLGMTSAKDWTAEFETKGLPDLKKAYALMGAPDAVQLWPQLQFGHNYNAPTREHIYAWFNRHFALGLPEPMSEREYPLLTPAQLTVWDAAHPAPKGGLEFEKKLLRWWRDDAAQQVATNPAIAREAWPVLVGRPYEADVSVTLKAHDAESAGEFTVHSGTLRNQAYGEEVSVTVLGRNAAPKSTFIWLSDASDDDSLFGDTGDAEATQLLKDGARVVSIEAFGRKGSAAAVLQPVVANPRQSLAYTLGYNDALLAERVQDVFTTVAWLRKETPKTRIALVGTGRGSAIALAAHAVCPEIAETIVDTEAPWSELTNWRDSNLLPGAAKYGQLATLRAADPTRSIIVAPDAAARRSALAALSQSMP